MSVHPKKEREERKPLTVLAHGSDTAPLLYFDGAVAYGIMGPIVQIELAATVRIPVSENGKESIRSRTIVVGHLRGSHEAMALLGDAIEKALMMTGPLDRNALPEKAAKAIDKAVKEKSNG